MSGEIPLLVRWLSRIGVIPRAAVTQLDVQQTPRADSVLDAARLAEQTYQALDKLGHEVVLIARMGQNLAQFGLKYSHLGFAVRGLRRGEWAVWHLLNTNDSNQSGIFQEGMVNFYSDQPYRFEAQLITLPADLQAQVVETLRSHSKRLHCANYSLTAYPWALEVQNSNQWVLEVLASAVLAASDVSSTISRETAQAWLAKNGYRPSELHISLPTQWAGPLLRDSIRFTDQPEDSRRDGRILTVTVDSVVDWLLGPASPFGDQRYLLRTLDLAL